MTTTALPQIRVDKVSLIFPDGTHALDDVSVTVSAGELVALVGPSGCGKSTLLRLVAGFEKAGMGAVTTSDHALGYVFQDATLLPWRSVLHNVELPGQLTGIPKASRRESARAAIDRVGLSGFERHRPAQLSGGMRMRVSIARALTLQPRLFLFDEPFSALDEITRLRMQDELQRLFQTQGFTGLFITHSVNEAVYLSTRVVVMTARPGRVKSVLELPQPYPRALAYNRGRNPLPRRAGVGRRWNDGSQGGARRGPRGRRRGTATGPRRPASRASSSGSAPATRRSTRPPPTTASAGSRPSSGAWTRRPRPGRGRARSTTTSCWRRPAGTATS